MLTRFISNKAWTAPEYVYPYDNTVSLKNTKLYVAGNLDINYVPFLNQLNDVANNNYSILYLTNKKELSGLLTVLEPTSTTLINSYPGLLGINAEGGFVTSETSFLECIPYYRHINDFDLFYASFNNNGKQLSGASILISTVGFNASSYEVSFTPEGSASIYNTSGAYGRVSIPVVEDILTSVKSITSNLESLNFCKYLSGVVNSFGEQQTTTITISSKNNTWNALNLSGCGLTFGNTYYGDLTGNILNFYRRFCIRFKVGNNIYSPVGYNDNELYAVPRTGTPGFDETTTTEDVARQLSAFFVDADPVNQFIGVSNVSYTSNSLTMTLTHKLCGSLSEPYRIYDALNINNLNFFIDELQQGADAGFKLRFGPYNEATTINFKLPKTFTSYNTNLNPKSISDFYLTQLQNYKEYTFSPYFTFNYSENNNVFFDINFIDDKVLSITHTLNDRTAILVSDDINKKLYFIDKSGLTESNKKLAEFSYLYDDINNNLIIYKTINSVIYGLNNNVGNLDYRAIEDFSNIPNECVFYVFTFGKNKKYINRNIWGSYTRELNTNNLNLNEERSYDVKNNFLFHTEYNNIENNINVNLLPLKNQLNEFYEQGRKTTGVDFRDYHSLYTGDNNEKGNLNISTGYTTTNKEYIFKSGQITWFHIPYNETFKTIDINDANFIVNGAIAGNTPVFSDRIWKKIGNYKYTSNLGSSKLEQTGQWLCAWLSGGSDGTNAVWIDRFYNPEIITEIEATKFTNNIDYIPSYISKNYGLGITDRRSTLKLEPGVWYAYSHIGTSDADKVINYLKKDIIQEGVIGIGLPTDGEYNFAGKYSGYLSIDKYKSPSNNFTLSFFGYSDDWNSIIGNQILGNYKDTGFGIFNYLEVNPFTYYFNNDKAGLYNIQNDKILSINLPPSLSGNIVGMFRRSFSENFHIVLDNFIVLEYDLNGVLIDSVDISSVMTNPEGKKILSVSNNTEKGVVLLDDFSYFIIDLISNIPIYYPESDKAEFVNFVINEPGMVFSVYIDSGGFVYIINGRCPIIRDDKLYFIDNSSQKKIKVFSLTTKEINLYIDSTQLESSPVSPEYTFSFHNTKTKITDNPYQTFNLNVLSGIGINFYTPSEINYNLGVSVFRGPYYFYNSDGKRIKTTPINPIYVNLDGNNWIERDQIVNEGTAQELYVDKFGYNTFFDNGGAIFISDPEYQETLASTLSTVGRVFVYNLKDNKLQKKGEINFAAESQIYDLNFLTGNNNVENLTAFPLSANIIFSNGSVVYQSPYGEGTAAAYMSAFSLAFAVSSQSFVSQPYFYSGNTVFNKISATFLPPLTSITTIVHQLTGIFNKTVVPTPNPTYTNKIHLSTFFDFTVYNQTISSFNLKIENKFPGATEKDMNFVAVNEYTNAGINTYSTTKVKSGIPITGQDDQRFGTKVVTINNNYERFIDEQIDLTIISSPGWLEGGFNTGKLTVFRDLVYNNGVTYLDSRDILPPVLDASVHFGNSLKKIDTKDVIGINTKLIRGSYVVAGAPSRTSSTPGSAFFYDFTEYNTTAPVSSYLIFYPSGPAETQFGYKVGITQEFMAVSSPLSSSSPTSKGAVTLYRYQYGRALNSSIPDGSKPYFLPLYTSIIAPPVGSSRFKFGYEFAINYDYLAVASLSSANYGNQTIVVDLYKNNHLNENIYYDRLQGIREMGPYFTEYKFLSTIPIPWTFSNITSTLEVSLNLKDNYLAVGAWDGDLEAFGNEKSKIHIVEIYKDKPLRVGNFEYTNDNPTKLKNYIGKTVALQKDRLISGTLFIYNTGNSMVHVANTINKAISSQSPLQSNIDSVTDNSFKLTVSVKVSAEDSQPDLFNTVNRSFSGQNIFKLENYTPGRSLIYSGDILTYAFSLDEKTHLLTDYNRIKTYDTLGDFEKTVYLNQIGLSPALSCTRFGIVNVIKSNNPYETFSLLGSDKIGNHYLINYDPSTNKIKSDLIDDVGFNNFFLPADNPNFNNVVLYNFNITNCHYMEDFVRVENKTPKLYFKLRLNNRLDYEDSLILQTQYASENLCKGWHHFGIVLDSINGNFTGYIDSNKIFDYKFDASKYVFSNILKDNILVGSTPYYNNSQFDDFYRYREPLFISNNIKMDSVKFFNAPLSQPEIKFLSYEKSAPSDMRFQLEYGERNYIDTITRVSKHKLPGRKSPFIDIIINDSLITDPELQKYYETKIIADLQSNLPGYVRINKIIWGSNKPNREKIIQGDINIGNTLTDVAGTEEEPILVSSTANIQAAAVKNITPTYTVPIAGINPFSSIISNTGSIGITPITPEVPPVIPTYDGLVTLANNIPLNTFNSLPLYPF